MSEENVRQDEEAPATPPLGTESDDASEFEQLFADDSSDDDGKSEVEVLKGKLERLEKGVSKFFSEQGRKKSEQSEKPAASKKEDAVLGTVQPSENPVLKALYLNANPEAREIWDEVEAEAKNLGKDPFTLYESSSYFKGEAKARAEAKKTVEESKLKVKQPSAQVDFAKTVDKIKPEEVATLTPSQKMEWLKRQAEKERMAVEE